MTSVVTPWIRTFWTDVFAQLGSCQENPRCAEFELQVVDCMEAHGVVQGQTKCRLLLEDFRECVLRGKQIQRMRIMTIERQRQIDAGEIDVNNGYDGHAPPPRMDSY